MPRMFVCNFVCIHVLFFDGFWAYLKVSAVIYVQIHMVQASYLEFHPTVCIYHKTIIQYGITQAQFEEQKHQVTTVDVENLQLIDRLHTMSSEIAYLKTTISDKQKQEEDLHRALEDSAVLESSMRGEIEQQHIRCEELEIEIENLQVHWIVLESVALDDQFILPTAINSNSMLTSFLTFYKCLAM